MGLCNRCNNHFVYLYYVAYGYNKDSYICTNCLATLHTENMKECGSAILYFSYRSACNNPQFTSSGINLTSSDYIINNWTKNLEFKPIRVRVGKHNMAKRRWDVWFVGPDSHIWHGVQYGDNTQLLHCKRTRKSV